MLILTHIIAVLLAPQLSAQPLEFEVASVKPNKSGDQVAQANMPLGPGSVYTPTGGLFSATNYPLATYIAFAYRIQGNQEQTLRAQLPDWVVTEHFDIEARADPSRDTKDQMRLMMRSLLADRFKLAIRYETRQVSVFALVVSKPGKFGPRFRPHLETPACSSVAPSQNTEIAGQFPALCGGLLPMPPSAPGRQNQGARNVTMAFLANQLTAMGRLDRPVFDKTGLTGTFDFAVEWEPEPNALQAPAADQRERTGPAFLDAIQEQLGLKLESQRGPLEVLVLDHVEHPSVN